MNRSIGPRGHVLLATAVAALLAACGGGGSGVYGGGGGLGTGGGYGGAGGGNYVATALVSDSAATPARNHDANLVNAWGLVFNPTGFSWVANAGTSTSTLYDGNGVPQSLVVAIPANPSGIVYNGTTDFAFTHGTASGAAPFVFATLEGQIAAWSPNVDMTHAFTIVDDSGAGASYTGLAIETGAAGDLLYAADFHNAHVSVFDGAFAPAATTGGFVDPTLPTGFAPFGIQQIGGKVYVAYAKQDAAAQRDVPGAGLGLVDVFDTQGTLLSHLIPAGGVLNAPWGMTIAPPNFGKFSGMLLVGNFGDGRINVFDPTTGAPQGTISNNDGSPIVLDGLWGLAFGNGLDAQPTNTLFYTSGPAAETHGLYGRIDMN